MTDFIWHFVDSFIIKFINNLLKSVFILIFLSYRCYSRARDYCTSGRHVVNMCVNVIRVCVYLQNWSHVISYVNKATATPDFSDGNLKNHDHQTLLTRLHCAYGLAELAMRKYKSAAKRFLDANLDYCDIPDLMSTQVHISHVIWTKLRKDYKNFCHLFNIDHL